MDILATPDVTRAAYACTTCSGTGRVPIAWHRHPEIFKARCRACSSLGWLEEAPEEKEDTGVGWRLRAIAAEETVAVKDAEIAAKDAEIALLTKSRG